jgi:hypothetical protein
VADQQILQVIFVTPLQRIHEASDPNLKFVTLFGKRSTNFRFIRVSSNYMILVWFMDLKYAPHLAAIMRRISNPPH